MTDLQGDHRLRLDVRIRAAPSVIFPLLSTPEGFASWMGDGSEIGAEAGAPMRVVYPNGVEAHGEVVEIEPPHRVVFTWGYKDGANGIEPGATRVTITLEEEEEATRLTLEHEGFDAADQAGAHRGGWRYYVALLTEAASAAAFDGFLTQRVEAFISAWGETDLDLRRQKLEECVCDDVVFRDAMGYTTGVDDLIGHISAALRFMPGVRLEARGEPARTHEVAVFGWRMVGPEGAELAVGDNVARLAGDGRFREVVGVRREGDDG
ncbi:MAG TPA: SRPBCC domain-containing protein [Longimicrobiales bacterium]|nr:SRPBCC domain-containing protein [Longimicrobiales bacterium]